MCLKLDSSIEVVVAEEAVSEDIRRLDEIKDIVQGNITIQQESTRRRMKHSTPKPALKIGDQQHQSPSQQHRGPLQHQALSQQHKAPQQHQALSQQHKAPLQHQDLSQQDQAPLQQQALS
ncbi:hypothetical protein E1301_Tti014473 [Triplophysa tibetana]|uniref:Uncharacterized protein n=1 Tax=Triplophysa tibetana TaxID=1572043 RepID=A0A5A9PM90_9TELE|nr:hypothetical protein E1301_Tti014473 [Triplophysa tibetana]